MKGRQALKNSGRISSPPGNYEPSATKRKLGISSIHALAWTGTRNSECDEQADGVHECSLMLESPLQEAARCVAETQEARRRLNSCA